MKTKRRRRRYKVPLKKQLELALNFVRSVAEQYRCGANADTVDEAKETLKEMGFDNE